METGEKNVRYKLLNNLFSAVDITKAAVSDFAKCIEENIEDEAIVRCFDEFVKLSTNYVNSLDNLSSLLTVELNWLPFINDKESKNGSSKNKIEIFPSPKIELFYADGHTPWSFWLSFKTSPEFESLLAELQAEWKNSNLRKVSELPPVGSFVICNDRDHVFRGIILSTYADKARVRNVDDTIIKVVKLNSIYTIKRKWNTIHAQTVQCCLTKDESLIKIWNADLSELFKNTLKEAKLSVTFIEECADCIPAKFLVNLNALGRASVDFNVWICDKIFPELIKHQDQPETLTLEELCESVIDPYYCEQEDIGPNSEHKKVQPCEFSDMPLVDMNPQFEETDIGRPWSSQLFIPPNPIMASYYLTQAAGGAAVYPVHPVLSSQGAIAAQFTTTTLYGSSNLNSNTNVFQLSPQITSTSSFILKPTNVTKTTLNVNTPVFEPRIKPQITATELKTPLFNETPSHCKDSTGQFRLEAASVSTKKQPVISKETGVCPMFSKKGFCLMPSCTKQHIMQPELDLSKDQSNSEISLHGKCSIVKQSLCTNNINQSKSAINVQTPVNPNTVVNLLLDQETETTEKNVYEEDEDVDLEEPCISGGYIPTDERRLCRFPSKNGRCWKLHCNKEHEETNKYKWTTDKHTTVANTFNYLNLPELGETIELLVTHVRNPVTFYARLPDVYSDIGEGVENIETFLTLHKSLNDPKNIKSYKTLPGIDAGTGEICIVRALDRYWKRALVLEPCQKSITVFYIDYGNEENVPEADLRLMEDRFNHLPAQAVMCTLSGLFCDFNDKELRIRGRKFLENMIKGKVITGKVISRNLDESSLDLVVNFEELNVNNIMAIKGFCEFTRASSPSSML